MKKILYLSTVLVAISTVVFGQSKSKGYANLGVTGFKSEKFGNNSAVTVTMGLSSGNHVGAGIGVDFFVLNKQRPKYVQGYADFRVFFAGLHKRASPYLAVQPGVIFLSKTYSPLNISAKGSFAINLMLGVQLKLKKAGAYLGIGYSNISFNSNETRIPFSGVRGSIGIAL